MQWNWQSRILKISVGELSRFSLASPAEEGVGRWRLELGVHWHQVLQDLASQEDERWTFEQAVSGSLHQQKWKFELQGRMDQFMPDPAQPIIREVKTISRELPANEEDLRAQYPHYFHQAMLYGFLVGKSGMIPRIELIFAEIQTGITQTVVLDDSDLHELHLHLKQLVDDLEERRAHFRQLKKFVVPLPFDEWRPGQEEARDQLILDLIPGATCLFEAPTGFGKTGLALEQALRRLVSGDVERILILTGKTTGQSPLLKQLEAFRQSDSGLTIHALRSRQDHTVNGDLEERMSVPEILERWAESGLSAPRLLAEGVQDLDTVKALGQRHGIPPWAITRMLLPYADVWIADFNYLFDPGVSSMLEMMSTFDPAKTLLIIDEAHNLPDRAAACHSHSLDAEILKSILSDIQFSRFPSKLIRHVDLLLTILKRQKPADSLDPPTEAEIIALLRDIASGLQEASFGLDELQPENRDWLWNVPFLLQDWDHPHLSFHIYAPAKGAVRIACLDASQVIAPVLHRFHSSILMSATLQPWDDFEAAIGLDGGTSSVSSADSFAVGRDGARPSNSYFNSRVLGHAPWLEGCFDVIVDARVDTRYRHRDRYLDLTAETIAASVDIEKGCTVAFFPSYRYAEQVLEKLTFHHAGLRCELQPRDLPLEEQNAFLERALHFDDILLLVLGSRFSEGIDSLGGMVRQAIVVSPSLPEVNALQKARESNVPGGSRAAFRSIYLIPGLQKISQAIGRLVRSPDQRARVLLHCKRFMEPEYQDLLPEYLQPRDFIVTDRDFEEKWINS
ncbi:MAG: ATP-dependent DNA helicase [Puniceicoccaceae bacterium]